MIHARGKLKAKDEIILDRKDFETLKAVLVPACNEYIETAAGIASKLRKQAEPLPDTGISGEKAWMNSIAMHIEKFSERVDYSVKNQSSNLKQLLKPHFLLVADEDRCVNMPGNCLNGGPLKLRPPGEGSLSTSRAIIEWQKASTRTPLEGELKPDEVRNQLEAAWKKVENAAMKTLPPEKMTKIYDKFFRDPNEGIY